MQIAIVSGGELELPLIAEIEANQLIIACDQGAARLLQHHVVPHHCVGDFDSLSQQDFQLLQELSTIIERFPPEKDYTDTELALNWAFQQVPERITIFAGIGTRLDHSLANLYLLVQGYEKKIPTFLRTLHSEATVLGPGEYQLQRREQFPFISFLPVTPTVEGVDLEGFRYPLSQATFRLGETLGISNELIDKTGTLRFQTGYLFAIFSRD